MRLRRCAAAARRRLAGERGYSLSEMLVVLAVIGIVVGALTQLFVSASTAEVDMTKRFQAQQQARLALDKLRREIHCASAVASTGGAWPSASIKITLGSYCPTGSGEVTWCTRASSTPGAWALYRISAASGTCTGGIKWADYLSNLTVPNGRIFDHPTLLPGNLDTVRVDLPVDLTPLIDVKQQYELKDDIVLRNAARP
jgi:prepilin-type N-terminal cleavage/methylation domain-containing protein